MALSAKGILVGGWPSYHRAFSWDNCPESRRLKNSVVTVPIHQDLDEHHMRYIAACIEDVMKEYSRPQEASDVGNVAPNYAVANGR
jgi:hypothetical protein